MKLMKYLLAVAMAAGIAPSMAEAQTRTIKFAFQNQKEHPQAMGAEKFAELVAAKSGGKIKVKLFPGGTLGGDLQTVSALQGGTMEMTVLNAGLLSGQVKDFEVFDFPFLFNNTQEADAVIDGALGKRLLAKLSDKALIGLAYWDLGFRNLTNGKRPIAKVEDVAGLKLRVMQTPIYIDIFKALGANAVPMPFPELYTALEQKAVDGQENPVTVIVTSKFYEVQKHITLTRHTYNPQALLISKKFWDTLSDPEKTILRDAGQEATAYQRQVSRARETESLETLKKAGLQVTELSPSELQRFRDRVKPVIDKHAQTVGLEVVNELNAAIAKARK
jgi:TRAP-type transport system periplasmic protein